MRLFGKSDTFGRRQWGGDRNLDPMPPVPVPAGRRAVAMGRLAVVVTIAAWLAFVALTVAKNLVTRQQGGPRSTWETLAYLLVMTPLTASALAYLITRLGFFYRAQAHQRVARAVIDDFFDERQPSLTVLIPSYREDARVVRMTLLSAALQEHPNPRIVLLVDDPPAPKYAKDELMLQEARALPGEVQQLLAAPRARFEHALARFEREAGHFGHPSLVEIRRLADHYEHAVAWLGELAESYQTVDHADAFLKTHVLGRLGGDLAITAAALHSAADEGVSLPTQRLHQLYRRLVWTFQAELSSFERKRYASLSHEPSKAMNLNSYIGLMGSNYRDVATPAGRVLRPVKDGGEIRIPDSDYILTLDADSVLLPEYCARLVYLLEQNQHERVAVAQTPYSAYPGSSTRLERIAGATTDLQHIVHQGMCYYDATFWVGANAVLRKRALDDVGETDYVGDWPIRRYIQDRTVIEDTESSIDLGTHGWKLLNYPERLSYSATPPDFGSLCVQRQRWANGGLLILPKLWRQSRERRRRGQRNTFSEMFLRVNYMASICWSTICLIVLLAYQFSDKLLNPLVFVIALPYFLAMSSDLRYCGYKRLDILRIYGFNLVLMPVNLAGVANSLVQGLTGAKGEFRRTPKVRNRTTAAMSQVILPYVLIGLSLFTLVHDYEHGRWVNAVFAGVNTVLASYAVVAFIGIRNSMVDIWVGVLGWLYKPERAPSRPRRAALEPVAIQTSLPDWEQVLHYGSTDGLSPAQTVPARTASTGFGLDADAHSEPTRSSSNGHGSLNHV